MSVEEVCREMAFVNRPFIGGKWRNCKPIRPGFDVRRPQGPCLMTSSGSACKPLPRSFTPSSSRADAALGSGQSIL